MKRNLLLSLVVITLLLGGCSDKSEEKTPKTSEKILQETAPASKTLFPKKETADASPVTTEEKVKSTVVEKSENVLAKALLVEEKTKVEQANKNSDKQIEDSFKKIEQARAQSASVITEALTAVEILDIEDNESAHGVPERVDSSKKYAASVITQVVHEVEAAKDASEATIATSVKSVESARAASSVSDPRPVSEIEIVKAKSKAQIAEAVAAVEVVKAKAVGEMAENVATVEMNKRVYGEGSAQLADAEAIAASQMAKSVGAVQVAEANALGEISKSVAAVEIASVQAGIINETVAKGQKYYLKEMKKSCGMNGAKFAAMHTQSEWEEIHNLAGFANEAKKICPQATLKEEGLEDLYAFSYAYAKDSGHVPSCE